MSNFIPQETIDRVRESADIVDIIGRDVVLKKAGREFKGLCPFHAEKTPSFHVHPQKKFYKCFGCGAGGNVFKFFMDFKRMSFPEAVRHVARLCGIPLD